MTSQQILQEAREEAVNKIVDEASSLIDGAGTTEEIEKIAHGVITSTLQAYKKALYEEEILRLEGEKKEWKPYEANETEVYNKVMQDQISHLKELKD